MKSKDCSQSTLAAASLFIDIHYSGMKYGESLARTSIRNPCFEYAGIYCSSLSANACHSYIHVIATGEMPPNVVCSKTTERESQLFAGTADRRWYSYARRCSYHPEKKRNSSPSIHQSWSYLIEPYFATYFEKRSHCRHVSWTKSWDHRTGVRCLLRAK